MYKLDKNVYDTYKEFFFFGIDEHGENQLYEALIFLTYFNEIRKKYIPKNKSIIYLKDKDDELKKNKNEYAKEEIIRMKKEWKKQYAIANQIPTGEQILEETIKRAKEIGIQYYRFVTLNNKSKLLANYNKAQRKEQEKEIEQRLRKVVQKKLQDGSIMIKDDDISISHEWLRNFAHYPEYSVNRYDQDYIIRNWTEEVYDILRYLEKTECSNKKEYYDIWLKTRIKRLENSDKISNKEEIGKLRLIIKKLKIIKDKQKENMDNNPIVSALKDMEI